MNQIAPVVLVNESASVAKNFCALELATTCAALQVIFCRALSRTRKVPAQIANEKKSKKRNPT